MGVEKGNIAVMATAGEKNRISAITSSWEGTILRSPKLLLSVLVLIIFIAAYGVMNILHRIPAISEDVDIFLDTLLLLLFLYPCLVLLVKRPYLNQVRERERTEEALSHSESRLRMILENNPYFMAVRNSDGVVLMASRKIADFYGTSPERMIGLPQAQLHKAAGLNDEDLERILAVDREVIETGESRFGLERMTHGDGFVRWYRYSRLPVTMPSGVRCVLSISSEITRKIKAEEAQQKVREDLERRVEERTAELLNTNRELRQAIATYRMTEKELVSSRAELRALSASLRSALEEERTRISREIHDELGQSLTALKFDLAATGNLLAPGQTALAEKTKSMIRFVDEILTVVKKISRELRPGVLDDLGLAAAIEWQAKEFQRRTGIPCEVVFIPEEIAVDPQRSTVIFRIFQEALTNITRHAGATGVEATLESRNGTYSLEVRDNGRGITKEEISGSQSLGIIGIRERVRWWGGEVRIEGSPGAGTVIKVTIPAGGEERPNAQYTHRG
jgi:PAS domain S-box-containing protein